jgi:membrane-associated phospholipid phosphatase
MAEAFELCMVLCFGISWPISIGKSWKSRSTKGKSVLFTLAIWVGYACGIAGKILGHNITYVLFFYVLNLIMVTIDIALYFRNRGLERQQLEESSVGGGVKS